MDFDKLILIYSDPSRWTLHDDRRTASKRDPLSHGQKLRDLLVGIFQGRDGHASLGPIDSESRQVREWLYDAEALTWIASIYETVWRPSEEALAADPVVSKTVFDTFSSNAAVVFFDSPRLDACVDREELIAFAKTHLDPVAVSRHGSPDALPSEEWAEELSTSSPEAYASLRLDWSHRSGPPGQPGSLTWEPQMCIFNYWPKSLNLAPALASEATTAHAAGTGDQRASPATVAPDRAAEILEDNYYRRFYRRFDQLRAIQYALGSADVRQYRPPFFYFAAPKEPPADPAEYLSGRLVRSIQPFASVNLGVSDPLSEQMTGGVLDGAFLVLRREIEPDVASMVTDFFLLFPSVTTSRDWADVEDRLSRQTDSLAYANLNARNLTVEVVGIIEEAEPQLEQWEARVWIWNSLLDTVASLIASIHRELASRRRRTSDAFLLVNRVQLALARMQRSIVNSTDVVGPRERYVQRALDEASDSAAGRAGTLIYRNVSALKRLAEMPGEDGLYRLIAERIARPLSRLREAEAQAEQLRRRVESQRVVTTEMLSVERWQEQESADRDQRRLTYGVAVLTLFAVFPLIIGHLDWSSLHEALARAPGPVHWTLPVAEFAHRWVIGLIVVLGCVVTLGLVALVVAQPMRNRRRGEVTPTRARLGATWEVVERHALQGGPPSKQTDLAVCGELAEIWNWLQDEGLSSDRTGLGARLRDDVDRVLVRIELLANRPEDFRLPLATLLLRDYGGRFFSTRMMAGVPVLATNVEVMSALERAGVDIDTARHVNEVALATSSGPIEGFVSALAQALYGERPPSTAQHEPAAARDVSEVGADAAMEAAAS